MDKVDSSDRSDIISRDEALPESDVDLLVDFATTPTFRGYMRLRFFLEDLLATKVDLITEGGLRDRVRPYVEKDAIRFLAQLEEPRTS